MSDGRTGIARAAACACLAVGMVQAACMAAEYYADPVRGDDSNDGRSAASAFKTLARATKGLRAGDVLNLAAGALFDESLVIGASGTPEAPILIRGNGAILSGAHPIDPDKWEPKGGDLWFQPSDRRWGALRQRVFIGDEMISPACMHPDDIDPAKLAPKTAIWQTKGIYFRAEAGKTPRDYGLVGGNGRSKAEHSGVIIRNQSYITVEDVVAERFPNDGFNVHGVCRGIVFRKIVARYNGDDGFSIHDDVGATVFGLHSHHNDFGIQDVNFSQTIVSGAVLEDNRICGFDVYGGVRVLRDAVVRSNGVRQMLVSSSLEKGKMPDSPLAAGMAYLESVKVEGGEGEPLVVGGAATVIARSCRFSGTRKGCSLGSGRVHFDNCTSDGCGTPDVISPKCVFTRSGGVAAK